VLVVVGGTWVYLWSPALLRSPARAWLYGAGLAMPALNGHVVSYTYSRLQKAHSGRKSASFMLRAGGVGLPGKFIEPGLLGCIVLVELQTSLVELDPLSAAY